MSEILTIRHATPQDADGLAAIEATGFPPEEAATPRQMRDRILAYGDHFWLLTTDGTVNGKPEPNAERILAFINGLVTDRPDLTDDMYADVAMHDPHGGWQMIFGVVTAPKARHRGYAGRLMRRVIEDARAAGRKGLVLTCKDGLVGFYERFGYVDEGVSGSTHGGVVWHQMRLRLQRERAGAEAGALSGMSDGTNGRGGRDE